MHSRRHLSARAALPFVWAMSLSVGLIAPSAAGEDDPAVALDLGVTIEASLATGDVDVYTVDAGAQFFVCGAADQRTVDVAVSVFDGSGAKVAQFDGPARGPEVFQFEASAAGTYRIEVRPFEKETGDYTIALRRAEPVAIEPASRVDQLMAAYDDVGTPGGVVGVVVAGELEFIRSYGAANLTHLVPFETNTRTNIGSTAKQFTAYAILLLAEQGKLTLDDDVRTHIPELPDLGETVTLRHLLTHTSGYREFLNTLAMAGRRIDQGDYIDRDELIRIVQRQPALQNIPGAEFNYNNTGYGLLATVVERVGESPFPEWMAANVFQPLSMHDTCVRRPGAVVAHSAQGYVPGDHGYRNAADLGASMGAGGIYTTVGDLAKWVRNYHTGALGSAHLFEQMSAPYTLSTGKSTGYGFGLFRDEFGGLPRVHHGGADTAHRSMVMYFPTLDAAVITQSNNGSFGGGVADRVARAFFADHFTTDDDSSKDGAAAKAAVEENATDFDPATFDAASFDRFVGRFFLDEAPNFVLTFSREGDALHVQATGQPRLDLLPISATSFEITGAPASVTFNEGEKGAFDTITLHQNGEHPGTRITDEPWSPTETQRDAYVGRYFCAELDVFYEITVVDEKLTLKVPRFDAVTLKPAAEHEFTGGFPVAKVVFEIDDAGVVTGLVASNGRARGLRFVRAE